MSSDPATAYRDASVLITGGLGFIGSTLAHRLVAAGADVTLVDAMLPECGGNRHNLVGIADRVSIHIADIRDRDAMRALVPGVDVIFNLAGTASHTASMADPFTDLDINCRGQIELLEACRAVNPGVKVVYAATRGQYGRAQTLPVDETHPLRPMDTNGIHKAAGEAYHLLYWDHYGLRTTSLRMTNTYGPRHLMKHHRQGVIGWFVRQVIDGAPIRVYGDGTQVRDTNFVDDVVEALCLAGSRDEADGETFNLGGIPVGLRDLAALLVEVAGQGSYELVPYPEASRGVEVGDYVADTSKIEQRLGWRPTVSLEDGLARTIDYYRREKAHYWP